jgi:hypothetical protein
MVKKISGPGGPKKAGEVSSVKETSKVSGIAEVSGISGVKGVSSVSGVSSRTSIEGVGTRITSKNQEEVFKTIESEAEKMFAGKRIPRKRQKTITDALKMAVIAATLKEEDEE